MKETSRIMYIEQKDGSLIGEAFIGRVFFSKTGKTLYYKNLELISLKGTGFKSNYCDKHSEASYWVSGCKKDGTDRLYDERLPIFIDEDHSDNTIFKCSSSKLTKFRHLNTSAMLKRA